jgi:hypothetical protein
MKVFELIQGLAALDRDLEIIVATDEEGNSFNPLHEVVLSKCYTDKWGSTEPVHPDDVPSYDEDDLHSCVVIWP